MPSIEHLADRLSAAVNSVLGPVADWLSGWVWGWPSQAPLIAMLLLGTGLYVTLRLVFIQLRGFRHAIDITRGRFDDPNDEGDLKHFQALTTALSATVGIGNIAGVAIAIRMGGPGALFWMWVTAFFGMAVKYSECTLSLRFRKVHPDGSVSGGPMYYIEKGLGPRFKPLAIFFAAAAMVCSFGSGCMNQSNTLAAQMQYELGIPTIWSAIVFAGLVALVIIGGIRRIGAVTAVLAPAMAIMYVVGALYILAVNWAQIPHGFALIFKNAFAPESLVGGGVASFLLTLMWGVKRGLFSNEAGQGSAPIAHAAAKTKEPVREGLVALLEPFIDTLVICTMTGLVIVMTGAWHERVPQSFGLKDVVGVVSPAAPRDADLQGLLAAQASAGGGLIEVLDGVPRDGGFTYLDSFLESPRLVTATGAPWSGTLAVTASGTLSVESGTGRPEIEGGALLTGSPLTAQGFRHGLPGEWGGIVVTIAVVLFAVSTGISWSYYGDRATEYLFGSAAIPVYRWGFIFFFFMGCLLSLEAVWTWGDVALGMMTFPNLLALLLLSPQVSRMTRDYFSREQKPYW